MYVRGTFSCSPINIYILSFTQLYSRLAAAYLASLWLNPWSISVLYYWRNKKSVCFPQEWNEADAAFCIWTILVRQFVSIVSLTLQENMLAK
jgi:hypothetical protein